MRVRINTLCWHVMGFGTNRDCAKLIRKLVQEEGETDIGLVCEEVIDTCLELDSRDNMTCCVVAFPGGMGVSEGGGGSIMKSRSKVGVMKRRNEREREWGPKSTPAKRAMERLEQRKLKMKLLMNSDQKLTKVRSSDGGSTLAKQ
jgi:serine/threonine protein phosphatase PrpC